MILNTVPTSQLKYKETYEKLKGHYLAGKEISEFPNVVHCLDFQKMRSLVSKVDFNKRICTLQCTTLLPIYNLPFVSKSAGSGIVRSGSIETSPRPWHVALHTFGSYQFSPFPPYSSKHGEDSVFGKKRKHGWFLFTLCYKRDGKFLKK